MTKKIVTDNVLINELDLEPIKFLMMKNGSFNSWDQKMADHVAELYRSFLYLIWKYPNEDIHPTYEIDVFWHGHILDTEKYVRDCELIFGKYIHHYPYAGLLGEESEKEAGDVIKRTIDLVSIEFPELIA
jgi:hypothetical protein